MLINSVFIRICTGQVNRFNDNIPKNIEDHLRPKRLKSGGV